MGRDHRDETQWTFLPEGQLGSHWARVLSLGSESLVALPFLQQASSNGPSSPLTCFINKVLLAHNHTCGLR